MTLLTLGAASGLILIAGLILIIFRFAAKPRAASTAAQSELQSLAFDIELPSPRIVAGISDVRDLIYIRSRAPHLEKTLLLERTRLARAWLRENRAHLHQLLRLHRLIGRTSENLSVALEFRVAATYCSLQLMLRAADTVVLCAGPFRTRRIGLAAMAAFDQLSTAIAETAQGLDAAKKASIRASWAQVS